MDVHQIVTLLSTPDISRKTVRFILDIVPDSSSINSEDLQDIINLAHEKNSRIRVPTQEQLKVASSEASSTFEKANQLGIKILAAGDPDFPTLLSTIDDPPVVLFAKGNTGYFNSDLAIAVIGTREPTLVGSGSAERIAEFLVQNNIVVVSGLALGCDTAAHQGALNGHGRTVAILAHGLDSVYPAKNRDLAEKILKNDGCLLSEYAPGVKAQSYYFVERDRLQSGLSASVIVVETDIKGGSMHTARFCLEQKRRLACAVPSAKLITHPKSQGNLKLIKENNAIPLKDKVDLEQFVRELKAEHLQNIQSNNSETSKEAETKKGRPNPVQNSGSSIIKLKPKLPPTGTQD